MRFLHEAKECIDILTNPSYTLEFKSEAIEKLQEVGESANISRSLSLKARVLVMSTFVALIIAPTVVVCAFSFLSAPAAIAASVALTIALTAVLYKAVEKNARQTEMVHQVASKFTLFNVEAGEGQKDNSCEDDASESILIPNKMALES